MTETKIVKNDSTGYGYKYASLADMARQGVPIPQMVTRVIDGAEFIFYKDSSGEWLQGARVVTPSSSKGQNEAQRYGSALTYARRYTVALANGIATDDDEKIETTRPPVQHQERPRMRPPAPQGQQARMTQPPPPQRIA